MLQLFYNFLIGMGMGALYLILFKLNRIIKEKKKIEKEEKDLENN